MAECVYQHQILVLESHNLLLQVGELASHYVLTVLNGSLADTLLEEPLPEPVGGDGDGGNGGHDLGVGQTRIHVLDGHHGLHPSCPVLAALRPQVQPLLRPRAY